VLFTDPQYSGAQGPKPYPTLITVARLEIP